MNRIATLLPYRRLRRALGTSGKSALVIVAAMVLMLSAVTPASAFWGSTGSTSAQVVTSTLGPPTNVSVPSTAVDAVEVNWAASTGNLEPEGYFVTRSGNADGTAAVPGCSTSPSQLATETTCTDTAPPGSYYYTVSAVYQSWTSMGTSSGIVTVSDSSVPAELGAASSYSVLARTAVVNTSTSTLSGDLGVSPGTTVSGFDPGTVAGQINAGDAPATLAQGALDTAFTELQGRTPDTQIAGDLGGRTLSSGTYHSGAALALTGVLILDAQGDADANFIFQTDAAFNTAASSRVVLANGAQASNVFWVVDGAARTGANSFLTGTVLADDAITLGDGTELIGRALSGDTVTLAHNNIRFTEALSPTLGIDPGPTATTQDTTPTISGTSNAIPSSPVSVEIAGQVHHTKVAVDGTWSVTTDALAAGIHFVEATVRDAAGNGGTAHQLLTVEVSPPPLALGLATSYSVLAATGIVNTGTTSLSGDMGVFPGTSVSGFPPGVLDGSIHAGDPDSAEAQTDLNAALLDGSSRAPHTEIIGDLGSLTMHTGVHHSRAALAITGDLTLDAQGDPDAVFIFQSDAAFNAAAGSKVILANGAQASNVFWIVTGAVGTGANSELSGTILARGAISLGASSALTGQVLSTGTVTMAANTITGAVPRPLPTTTPLQEPSPTPDPPVEPSPTATPTTEPAPLVEASPTAEPPGEATDTVEPTIEPTPSTAPSVEPTPTVVPSNEPTPPELPSSKTTATPVPSIEPGAEVVP